MSREVCGICWCPYDEYTGECACLPEPNALLPRKPLSEEEILSLFRTAGSPVEFARAIERAHGIGSSDVGT